MALAPTDRLPRWPQTCAKPLTCHILWKKQQQYDSDDILSCTAFAGEAVAGAIRKRVRDEVRVTCSCGIGPNRLLAKVASDMRKPDGQYAISADNTAILRFVETLPIRKVQGIGKASASPPSLIIWNKLPDFHHMIFTMPCSRHRKKGVLTMVQTLVFVYHQGLGRPGNRL